jgi:hypothetical protein
MNGGVLVARTLPGLVILSVTVDLDAKVARIERTPARREAGNR